MRHSRWCVIAAVLLVGFSLLPTEAQAAKRLALVVGVKEYPVSEKLPNLTYTEADATKLAGTLKTAGYNVTLMTQAVASSGTNKRRFAPMADFIRKQFADLVETPFLKQEDCVLVILEGHGIQLPSKTNPNKVTFYFCASDSNIDNLKFSEEVTDRHHLIPVEELYATLSKSSAGVKLLVTDACRNNPNKPDAFRAPNSATRPAVPIPTGGMAAFFSCSAGQKAVEDGDLKQGVFSHYLNEGLSGKADSDKNGEVTISELQAYVGFQTFTFVRKKYSRKQTPELTGKVQGFAPLLAVANSNSNTSPLITPTPMPVVPKANQFAGSQAGDLWEKNGLSMKFRWCPPGTFTMGSPESEPDRNDDEDQVKVTLTNGFWLGQYEVTQGEWEKLMGTDVDDQRQKEGGSNLYGEGGSHPMYYVSWDEAMEFCQKLTEQERKAGRLPADWVYTLPTEAQWEYACRAGTTTATAFGNSLSSSQANFDGDSPYNGAAKGVDKKETVVVGSYKPNAWNLYDMHGNVWEWCRDYYVEKLPGGTDPEMLERSSLRVDRGGSWILDGQDCRSAYRDVFTPDSRDLDLGFRLAAVQQD